MTLDRWIARPGVRTLAPYHQRRRRPSALALVGVIALLPLATGCSEAIGLATGAGAASGAIVSGASLAVTDRTVSDHVVSLVTGHDCSAVRYFDGGYYCVPQAAPNTPVETRLYCYRSIGGITCYDTKVPGEDSRMVSDPRHVVGARTVQGPAADQIPGQH